MRRTSTIIKLIILILSLVGLHFLDSQAQDFKGGVLQGSVRIKVKPEVITSAKGLDTYTSKGVIVTGIKSIDKVNSTFSVNNMRRVFPYSPQFEERHMKHGLHLWYEVSYSSKAQASDLVKAYMEVPEVEISEQILEPILIDGSSTPKYITPDKQSAISKSLPFNDPLLNKQWHYNNTGQTGGTPGADINLFKAWETTHGTSNVIVAVMDQGVDYTHEDLKNMMWVNNVELNGKSGVDDDNNGFIDDIYGVNFSTNTGNIKIDFHGTHVAGTVAAENNNGLGVSGVAGGSGNQDGVRVMTCQIIGGSAAPDIPAAYVYASDMGAVISQNSWGYTSAGFYEQAVHDAIDYFIAESGNYPSSPMKGGVVIFASGNSNTQQLMYPGAYPSVISVDALNSRSYKASYSNYGTWTDISAPGGDFEDNTILNPPMGYSNGVLSTLPSNSYGYLDGTSMACPHVSGIAGLVVSKYGGADFTNEKLKAHLLTGVRYIYNISGNENYSGKLGSGYSDAVLALAQDNGIAPDKINDLALTGIAQDFASISWTVPADADDGKPLSFEILYSTEEITESNLGYARILTKTNLDPQGAAQTFEIPNLQSLTLYYIAVRSIDRWGNKSDFSNIISGTTNNGPTAYIDSTVNALNISIDVQNNPVGIDSVKLFNVGDGVLRWDVLSNHISAVPLSTKPDLRYPTVNPFAVPQKILSNDVQPSILNNIQHDTSLYKGYVNLNVSFKVFGETNFDIPNSSATRFYVNETDGFNLTHTEAYFRVDTSLGPIILEIYKGSNISDAQLLLAQEYKPDISEGFFYIQLNEQLYFKKGEYFWVVYHVPAGNKYPLGGGLELNSEDSKNCYLSLNGGKSWTILEQLYLDSRVVWAVFAYSKSQNINNYLVLRPDSGIVASNQHSYISAKVDASALINGAYKSKMVVNTNETTNRMLRLPINVNITGHKPVIESTKRNYFGSILIGNYKDIQINFKNTGFGRLKFNTSICTISNPQFKYIGGASTNFEAKTSQTLTFRFTPQTIGSSIAIVTLQDVNGNNYSFELFGSGVEPPKAELNPESVTYNNLALGTAIKDSVYLKNSGKFPLDYYLPAFASGSNMEVKPVDIQKFAYASKIDTTGGLFVWNDISTTGNDITANLAGNKMTNAHYKIQLDFLFPFYGKNENSVFITKYGILSFDEGKMWALSPLQYKAPYPYLPYRYICGAGFPMLTQDAGYGKIYYKQFSDKLIVQYDNCPHYDGVNYDPVTGTTTNDSKLTFQIVLYDNGNINMYYKESNLKSNSSWTYIGMEDKNQDDGLLIYGRKYKDYDHFYGHFNYNANSTIQITSPGLGLFQDVSNAFGTVMPNDSVKINYTIKTDSLYLLPYLENLVIVTNDPVKNPAVHKVYFTINSGGVADVVADTSGFDFGTLFKNETMVKQFYLINQGKAVNDIVSATFDNGYFTISGNFPEVIKPERKIPYGISINTSAIGVFKDTLRINTSSGQVVKLALSGEVIQGPIMNLLTTTGSNLTSVTKILASGLTTSQNFKISNTGAANLHVAPHSNQWAKIREANSSVNEFSYTYNWKSSKDFGGPTYKWIEIAGNGGTRVTGLSTINGPQWSQAIPLPFSFDFYGNSYDTLYIGVSGLVTFTKDQNNYDYFFGSWPIPRKGEPDNFIAPLFLFGGPQWPEQYPLSDPWYKIESDRIIIEYYDYNTNFSMGQNISAQVILFANGNIKFQYLMPENSENTVTSYSAIGIENIDGTDGVQIAYNDKYINSNMSVMLYPVRTYSVLPGQSKDFVMDFSAVGLNANTYSDSLVFHSNDPLAINKKLPVKLIVSGTPVIEKPDSIAFGDVMINSKVPSITKEFEIKNTGTANYTISGMSNTLGSLLKVEAYVYANNLWSWIPISDASLFPRTIYAETSLKLRATIKPTSPLVINDVLTITTSLSPSTYSIPVIARIYSPAVVSVDKDTISYYAQTSSFTKTHLMTLSNLGGYPLNYKLSIEFLRESQQSKALANSTTVHLSNPASIKIPDIIPVSIGKSSFNSEKGGQSFDLVLSYDSDTVSKGRLGYGGSQEFQVATGFYAPDKGFNLTHVQTWYYPGEKLNSTIGVKIYGGAEDINNCTLVYSETFNHTISAADNTGSLLTFKLTSNVSFFPNEKFFVVFVYESAVTYPQGVAKVINNIPNRFMFISEGIWTDLSEYSQFSDIGWMVRAVQETPGSTAWVELESTLPSSVEPSNCDTVQLGFNAAKVNDGDNYALLHVATNDIKTPIKDVVLHLRKNQGPVFESKDALTVNENETLEFNLTATDLEGDDFSIALTENYPFLSVVTTKSTSGTNDFGFTPLTKTIKLQYKPDYTCQGEHDFIVKSTDSFGNSKNTTVVVNVKNVNRPPVAVNRDTLKINPTGINVLLTLNTIFTDPDNDIKSVSAVVNTLGVLNLFNSGNDFLILPIVNSGKTSITFVATDAYGATATNVLQVSISNLFTEVDDNNLMVNDIQVYPNPTSSNLNINIPNDINEAITVDVINTLGIVMKSIKLSSNTTSFQMDIGSLANGLYIIRIASEHTNKTVRIIKK